MLARAITVALGLLIAGCAAERPAPFADAPIAYLGGPAEDAGLPVPAPAPAATVKPSKVLAAIAFERVTGRDVDPARLVD
jgi:hypothetical protein